MVPPISAPSGYPKPVAKPSDTVIDGIPPTGVRNIVSIVRRNPGVPISSSKLHRSRLAARGQRRGRLLTVDTVPPTLSVLS